jgi:hypothetical protein
MRYLISILGLAIVVGTGYFTVAQYISVANGQTGLKPTKTVDSTSGAQVLALLNKLNSIKLDGQIFENEKFMSLQDWGVTIAPQTIGRQNPYLPAVGAAPITAPNARVNLPRTTR